MVSGVDFGNQWLAGTLAFTSTAPTVAMVGQPYGYEAEANDTDGDTLTYDLPLAPAGMVVDPTTGAVVWTPTSAEIGPQTVILRAQDGNGGVVLQSFTVYVVPPNYPPVITSPPPPPTAVENVPYQYQLTAQDADTDPLTWQLSDQGQITPDISIGAFTGLLTWTPQPQDLGTNYITVTVSDGRGGYGPADVRHHGRCFRPERVAGDHVDAAHPGAARLDLCLSGTGLRSGRRSGHV